MAEFVACMRRADADTVTHRLRESLGGRAVASMMLEAECRMELDSIDEALEKYPFEEPRWQPVRECAVKLEADASEAPPGR